MSYFEDEIEPYIGLAEDYAMEMAEIESKKHIVWTTKNGKFIRYSKMSTSHLINCRNMILRGDGWRRDFLPFIEAELRKRGVIGRRNARNTLKKER